MIKVVHDGVEYHCETADEAIELGARLRGTSVPMTKKGVHAEHSIAGSRWTVSRFQSFLAQLKDNQRKFLSIVINSPDGVTDSQLRQSLGLTTNKAFGPILTGISRKAKKAGISLQDILSSEKVQLSADERVMEFKATAAFAQIAKEGGGIK
jgi:hypothetical protein